MKKAVGLIAREIKRTKPPGGGLKTGLMIAGLLASTNLAVQAVDFNPVADSYTDEAASSENNATGSRLRVRSSASGNGQIAFFKFDVSGLSGSVNGATLKLRAKLGTGDPVTAYAVSDNSWTETGITWNNQPALGSALDTVNVADGVYNNFDVSGLITGDGTYTIALQGGADVEQNFRSREHSDLPILTVDDGSPPVSSSDFEIVSSPYPTEDIIVISETATDHGIANDGSVDVTSKIQTMLDLVHTKGGGTAFLPEGTYRIDGNLIIPTGVWLRGVWEEPTAGQPINGTVLAIYGGRNSTNSIPVIHHLESSGTKDLVFWYPEQDPANIVPYPPTIGGYRALDGDYKGLQRAIGMKNLTFVNSYIAISAIAEDPTASVGSHFNIENVYGTALYRGVDSNYISGNSKWTGLFFSPDYWSGSGFPGSPSDSSHETWAKNNGAGIRIATKGQIYIQCARFSGFKWGLLQDGEGSDASLYDCHFTNCEIGMSVLAYSMRAVNCVFEGSQNGLYWNEDSNNMGEGVYHSCTFSGGTASVNISKCESQDFQACTFNDKVIHGKGVFAAVDCDFNFAGPHVELTNKAEGLALMGNRYTGGFNLDDGSTDCWVKVDHTPLTFKQLPSFTYADYRTTVQDFKPAVAQLFDALDYGAVGDGVTDDTAAIQATIDAAAAAGGAIAFLPPRIYNVPGTLNVPSHVELRGSSDGHHTANGDLNATLLLVSNDHGNANGTPFITLQANSGLRGMSFFYPNQDAPFYDYPYLVRGAGANVYVFNTHAPNVSRMCDFATYRCDNFVAYNVYQGALHNGYNVGNGTTGGRIYGGMGKSFWGQLPAAIEPSYPATDPDHFATEFLHHIMAGDCSDLVVFGNYCRSNNTGIETYDEGGKGPSGMIVMNTGGEGTRVCYEINKLSGDLYILTSGNKCGSAQPNDPIQAQFKLNYSDPYTVAVAGNVMDTSGEMEVTIEDGNLEITTTRLDQQVAKSGFWVDTPGSLRMSAVYMPELGVFDGAGNLDLVGCHLREGAADSNRVRLNNLWLDNIIEKIGRCAVACTYENPYFCGLEILDTADSDYYPTVDPYNENNWYSCIRPVLVSGQNKKKLYLDVVNPDLINVPLTGKIAVGYHTIDTAGVVGDTMVNVYYDRNGQTLAGSFDAADPLLGERFRSVTFDITDAALNNGINGGDVLIEIGADANVSILWVEVRDTTAVSDLPDVPGNNPPAFSSDPIVEADADEDAAYTGSIAGSATDPDSDPLTFSKVSGPAWLSVAADGSLSGTPAQSDVGANAFVVEVADNSAATDQATLNITVLNVNDDPVLGALSFANADEDASYSGSVDNATDEDGDNLTYSKISGPAWLNIAADGSLSGTPVQSDVGTVSVTVQVVDGNGGSDSDSANITVLNVNDAPVFTANPIAGAGALEDAVYADSIAGSATDEEGDSLTYAKVSGPAWLSVASNGALSGIPGNGNVGLNVFTVSVSDGIAPAVQATLNVTVLNVNDAPVFTADPIVGTGAEEDAAYTGSIAGTAVDEEGDPLTYAKVSGPAWLSVASSGALSGTPASGDVGLNSFSVQVSDGNGGMDSTTLEITVEEAVGTGPEIRVTEYYVTTGDFSGTSMTLTLDQDLADDYYILVRGSRTGDGLLNPDSGYARVTAVPNGKGDLPASGAADQITLGRFVADTDWEGVVTVVECGNSASAAGFKLVDAVETSLSGNSGTDTSAAWADLSRVVLFGGYRGGGAAFSAAAGSRNHSASVFTRLSPSGSGTINWSRNAAGETQVNAVMTTFVVEWGSEWTVQHVNVSGANGGNGADATGEYATTAISAVDRDNTWVWATGTRQDAGIGDCAESCLVTLGDGVNQNASESTVAVGSEYSDAYDFDVYVLSHPAIAVDHRFKVDGNSTGLDVAVAVDSAAVGARFGWVYNGVNGTGTYHPRDIFWARYTADGEVTVSRGFDGQNFPAWVQGIDLSGLNQ